MSEIGIAVDPSPAPRPQPTVLTGRVVTLRPFDRATQAEALYQSTHGPDKDDLWRYMGDGPFPSRAAFEAAFDKKQSSVDPLFFAIVDNASGVPVGQAAYMRIDPANRVIEVGNIIFTPLCSTPAARPRPCISWRGTPSMTWATAATNGNVTL